MEKVQTAILALVIVAIIVSGGTLYYVSSVMSQLSAEMSALSEDVDDLRESTGEALLGLTGEVGKVVGLSEDIEEITSLIENEILPYVRVTPVRMAALTHVVDSAPSFFPYFKGWYRDAGLAVELVKVASGAEALEAALAGAIDIGNSAFLYTWSSVIAGNPILFLATQAAFDAEHRTECLMVRKDLFDAGLNQMGPEIFEHTIHMHVWGTEQEASLYEWGAKYGVPKEQVKLDITKYPHQAAAFAAGTIDIAHGAEPFITDMIEKGVAVPLPDPDDPEGGRLVTQFILSRKYGLGDWWPMNALWVTEDYAEEHPEAVEAYIEQFQRGILYMETFPAEKIDTVVTYTGISSEIVSTIAWSKFDWKAPISQLQTLMDKLYEDGLLDAAVVVADHVAPQAITA